MARETIDPQVPYIQVHRSVGAKAAQLAPVLGVTYQHVRGALDVFWEGLADRRILAGKSELLLTAEELDTRLRLAFGMEVKLGDLVALGLLEFREGLYRVRGMSRYLVMEALRASKKGVAPKSDPGATPVPPRSNPGAAPERREARGETGEAKGKREKQLAPGEVFFAWAQAERLRIAGRPFEPAPRDLSTWFSEALMAVSEARLKAGYRVFLKTKHWVEQGLPWAGWRAQWSTFVPAADPVEESRPMPPDGALALLKAKLTPYQLNLVITRNLTWRRDGEVWVGATADPYEADAMNENMAVAGVRYEFVPKAGA